jgi:cell division protein FtsB
MSAEELRLQTGRRPSWERKTRIAVASLAVIAMMFLFVFPTRAYLAQQRQVHDARKELEILRSQNKELGREAQTLQTPSEIERLARAQFNMVLPGEHAYTVVPPATEPSATTPAG